MAKLEQSETELSDVKSTKTNDDVEDVDKTIGTPIALSDRLKAFFNFFTVEPFLFCYILPSVISAVAVQKLNMEKACRTDLNYSEYTCTEAIAGRFNDNLTTKAVVGAQAMVADMAIWVQPLQSGIPALVILFVGAWSDATGNRKSLMLVPIIGELISSIGLILANYYFLEWPLWVTGLIEAIPSAFTGGISIALMGSYSYIADLTTTESRTFRMGCVAVIVTLGIPLGSSISGILTESLGYYGVFGINAVLYIFGFIHTYFKIHDVRNVPIEGTIYKKIAQFFNPLNVWYTLSLLFLSPKRELIQIWLIVWAHIIVMGPVFGENTVLYLYTLKKFSMDIVAFSLFSTYSVLMGLVGTAIAVTLFSKRLQMQDALIGVIATSCKVVSSFVYAFAPTKGWFHAGPVFDLFGNSGTTVVRSLGTKVVDPEKVGRMCSLIGFVEALVPVAYTPIYSGVYKITFLWFPGFFYLLGAVMTMPAIAIFVALYIMHRRQARDVVKNPDAKEMYAHENTVIAL